MINSGVQVAATILAVLGRMNTNSWMARKTVIAFFLAIMIRRLVGS